MARQGGHHWSQRRMVKTEKVNGGNLHRSVGLGWRDRFRIPKPTPRRG
jgi:hypothetical protein